MRSVCVRWWLIVVHARALVCLVIVLPVVIYVVLSRVLNFESLRE